MRELVFVCDRCHYLFSGNVQPEQCPDCGKCDVRPADKAEIAEFERNLVEAQRFPL